MNELAKLDDFMIRILSDIDGQPDWRSAAKVANAYYDGDQLSPKVREKLEERGQPTTVHNLIAPTIDGVLGMEAKTRTDLLVCADDPDEQMELMAEAVNAEFSDAARLGRLDKARSEAYASMIKSGVGFVEAYRNPNPFGPKYKIKPVPRDEMFWDWFSTEGDWSDCRWAMRMRWMDIDELATLVPDKASILEYAKKDWKGFIDVENLEGLDPHLTSAHQAFNNWSRDHSEYLSHNRERIRLQVVYVRHIERKPVVETQDGRVVEFNQNDLPQAMAIAMGRATVRQAQVSRIKEEWYAGMYHLMSRDCDAPFGMFPIVPFWGFRKDSSGEPYGLIARAIPAQDEVNFRRIKLTWLLQAKRVLMDEDATNMSQQQVLEEVERPDGLIKLNPNRKNQKSIADVFQVQQDFNIAAQQFNVMQDSMKLIQDTMGVYGAFLGQESNATSGIAIANLVEQGATTLAEINDNYNFGSQLLGELLLGYILEDMKQQQNKAIVINRDDKRKRKTVVVNEVGEGGLINNDLTRLRAHIALAPIQQTAAYKSQLAERMMMITAQLPPEVQITVIDLVLELTDVPNKQEFMERVRSALNIQKDPEDMTEEEQAAVQQQQQQQQALQQKQLELQMREMEAKVLKLESEAKNIMAKAQREVGLTDSQRYDNAKTQAETKRIMQEIESLNLEMQAMQGQMLQTVESMIDQL
ncbi:TPA: portal protein [Vibrio vulnificus]|uniref:Portal protein n=1 Tax=Vibrio vulnificus TaxID=672 RepID=A0AAW4H6E6_VIBVL|nr:portal protein [Vibrio vulnificus]EKA7348899.1 portal protein [Vibrio vulnificus]MBN8120509.1 portal protein [Vibrio vulnificus]MCU8217753.1 portal protein [Vibrio vulnificus]HDY7976502.1 portal protein [Vibrio vulnificus]HDY8024678.1 portal protein [Vibrio vulnificus]